jgi:hypothetical protein
MNHAWHFGYQFSYRCNSKSNFGNEKERFSKKERKELGHFPLWIQFHHLCGAHDDVFCAD